jgi:hypothetical protein
MPHAVDRIYQPEAHPAVVGVWATQPQDLKVSLENPVLRRIVTDRLEAMRFLFVAGTLPLLAVEVAAREAARQ